MKYTLPILLLAVLPALAQKASVKPYMPASPLLDVLEKENGFRDAHFGADTTSFKDLVFDMQISDSVLHRQPRLYARANDDKWVYGAKAQEIIYSFEQGKLTSVSINTHDLANSRALLYGLKKKYGPGLKRPYSSLGNYWWSTTHVLLSYTEDPETGEAQVAYISKPDKTRKGANSTTTGKR